METQSNPMEPSGSPPAAEDPPSWVMLNCNGCRRDESSVTDPKTMAESPTSIGRPFRVSLGLAKPPASSILYYEWIGDSHIEGEYPCDDPKVIAAHGDSVLIEMARWKQVRPTVYDYFVYRAGASRLPLLSQLPARGFPTRCDRDNGVCREPSERNLSVRNTGLLRRGENELQVVQLEMTAGSDLENFADLCILHLNRSEWELKPAVPIVAAHNGSNEDQTMSRFGGNMVVPVGDRFMCLVDYHDGLMVHDLVQDCPRLHYVPMPVKSLT
ncbi:hypothetical protein EJB05_29069, partial [Eragrostis curvula]